MIHVYAHAGMIVEAEALFRERTQSNNNSNSNLSPSPSYLYPASSALASHHFGDEEAARPHHVDPTLVERRGSIRRWPLGCA